ncbi:DASH family cryptochrome [Vibrio metschnikovii]|uniref:DASH family cryptochrome n=1 Tax=Vibrio metschnikovii TaxID=28172 RepID=UPI001C2FAEB6|nr:DASH family cryptochrome [Vibrio metschnikovii]
MSIRSLYWFTNDLRISDNPLLAQAAQNSHQLTCCYLLPSLTPLEQRFQVVASNGLAKQRFLLESLADLGTKLQTLGQSLQIASGDAVSQLCQFIELTEANHLYVSESVDFAIHQTLREVRLRYPQLTVVSLNTHRLFEQAELPFSLAALPGSFSVFRKQVESLDGRYSSQSARWNSDITALPPSVISSSSSWLSTTIRSINVELRSSPVWRGGESAALEHLEDYFSSDAPLIYKQTRNALDEWESSTKFSPWLANGCLSIGRLLARLNDYETQRGANESTYWIYFELLWREYFQWYALKYGAELFQFSGIKGQVPLTSYYPQRMRSWINGTTPYPIVNAAMKQLKATGYLSNRSRQLVASCLVHELSIDWRYGAQYFQSQLIDYDVASNWGNWQYLAGVGADPRGHRRFDLAKQTALYDPELSFIRHWQGEADQHSIDVVDMVDWPVSPAQ